MTKTTTSASPDLKLRCSTTCATTRKLQKKTWPLLSKRRRPTCSSQELCVPHVNSKQKAYFFQGASRPIDPCVTASLPQVVRRGQLFLLPHSDTTPTTPQ